MPHGSDAILFIYLLIIFALCTQTNLRLKVSIASPPEICFSYTNSLAGINKINIKILFFIEGWE